ncbi:hypothetical protein [Variovorax paradoxus]|uniref:hypothetical protein n=1 Tax=Variovorax paradoxus TaxID=34073 RepID=UPI00069A56EE|nr:hypothetical protein [Variovorax paradoxus]
MDKIPVPTDNIFKFYALFGLLLFVFGVGAIIALQRSTNDYLYRSTIDLETVKAIAQPTPPDVAKRELLGKLIVVAKSDKDFLGHCLSAIAALGFWLGVYGFYKWHKDVQPVQDEMLQLQVEKLRREVAALSPVPIPPVPYAAESQAKGSPDQSHGAGI